MIRSFDITDAPYAIEEVRRINSGGCKYGYVVTFGCQQNEADSEKIRGLLLAMGYEICGKAEDADIIIMNTCAIREHAEMKALSMLGRFKELKRKNPDLIVGVMGCMAAEPKVVEMLKCDFHYVSFTIEPSMLHKLPLLVLEYIVKHNRSFVFGTDDGIITEGVPKRRNSKHKAWVSVMYGCNNFCSYCIVPYVRGRERSRPSDGVVAECAELVKNGTREITLLGQNVNSYSSDIDFPDLVRRIAEIPGDFIIRFMTSHPKDVSDKLIDVMAEYRGKVAPYFHLPLQSGSNKILNLMNRTYDRERFMSVAGRLRECIPGIALSTDVIVGFPGEEDEDYLDTLDVLSRVEFDMVYAFIFSPRIGTPASEMKNTVPDNIKHERLSNLLKIQDDISLAKNLPYVGRTERVLVDSLSSRDGRTIANGRTPSNKLVHFETDKEEYGRFASVRIDTANRFDLLGTEIK